MKTTPLKTIEIIISPQGQTTLQTKGFSGAGCQQASRWLEEALGQRAQERLTDEFYQTEQSRQQQEQSPS